MTSSTAVAIVGVGGWGKNLLRNFVLLCGHRLKWVCDRSDEARASAARTYPHVRITESIAAILDDPEVGAVVVATDAQSHHGIAKAALEADKDVFVEKPLALSVGDAEDLCITAERRDRILMVGHLLLYHPAVEALRRLVGDGELGEILYLYTQRLNLGVGRRDENSWWSLAPHDLAVADYLFGDAPISIAAHGGVFLQKQTGVEDVVFATVQYPKSRLANIHVSWLDPHKTRRLTVVGTKKMAVFDDTSADQKLVVFEKGAEPRHATLSYEEGVRVRTGEIRIPVLQMREPLRLECEAFLQAVETRRPPLTDGRSGLTVVRSLAAGSESLVSGGHPVRVAPAKPSS